MRLKINNIFCILLAAVSLAGTAVSCGDDEDFKIKGGESSGGNNSHENRLQSDETRKVMILYAAGFNNLSSYMKANVDSLKKGYLPSDARYDDILLIFSKYPQAGTRNYKIQTSPTLTRLYRNQSGDVVEDTVLTMDSGTIAASSETMSTVLNYIKDNYPARSYGMVFSSHSTGWLPAGYYESPSRYDSYSRGGASLRSLYPAQYPGAVPYVEKYHDPSLPLTKTFGQETFYVNDRTSMSYEMEFEDFAAAIPMHLDYILFDACFGACVETAYALKDKCGYIGGSAAEVLAEGLDYTTMASHLLKPTDPDPKSVCEDFFKRYDSQSGVYRSATISLIDCSALDNLAFVCKDIFSRYSSEISSVDESTIQGFFRYGKHWFYDLRDILVKSGVSSSDLATFDSALSRAVAYSAATPTFILPSEDSADTDDGFRVNTHCGLTMYLPCDGSNYLDSFYKPLSWNKAVSLVN